MERMLLFSIGLYVGLLIKAFHVILLLSDLSTHLRHIFNQSPHTVLFLLQLYFNSINLPSLKPAKKYTFDSLLKLK